MKEITMTFLHDYPGVRVEYNAVDQADQLWMMRLEYKLGNPRLSISRRRPKGRKWHEYKFMTNDVLSEPFNGKMAEALLTMSQFIDVSAVGLPDGDRVNLPGIFAETIAYSVEVHDVVPEQNTSSEELPKGKWNRFPFNFLRLPLDL